MSDFPKDGSTFVVEAIDRTAYRWAKYKPDGARQMVKPGRWQKQVWSGDYFKWENCEDPVGELSPPVEDGPISKAFKQAGALEHWRQEVGKLHSQVAAKDAEIENIRAQLVRMVDIAEARLFEIERLREELASIRLYANDTLSGRADGGPDDWAWQREAVIECRNRARDALKEKSDA